MTGFNNIQIDKSEVLRYLGHKNQKVDENTQRMIDSCIDEIQGLSRYRYTYQVFETKIGFYKGMSCIELKCTNLKLTGNDIYEHLRDCRKCAVMAVTLGIEVDNAIRVAQNSDMLKAVVMDSCATEYIEKICDEVEEMIGREAAADGCGINYRFSPGYGDLPISTQKELLSVIDAGRKMGITLTDSFLMIPGKSVTAIVGFTKSLNPKPKRTKCDICSMRDRCAFRKAGKTCGRS